MDIEIDWDSIGCVICGKFCSDGTMTCSKACTEKFLEICTRVM